MIHAASMGSPCGLRAWQLQQGGLCAGALLMRLLVRLHAQGLEVAGACFVQTKSSAKQRTGRIQHQLQLLCRLAVGSRSGSR